MVDVNNPLGFLDGEEYVAPKSMVQLHLEGFKLAKLDMTSKSDPFAVLYVRSTNPEKPWEEIGRTETVKNNENPKFVKAFDFEYAFEKMTEIRIEVYDRDSGSEKLADHDYIGASETTLVQIVTSPGQTLVLSLENEHKRRLKSGFIKINAEQSTSAQKRSFFMDFGVRLPKKSQKRHKLTISRCRDDGSWQVVFQSEMVRALETSARFKSISLSAQDLCGNDESKPILIRLVGEKEKSLAETQTTFGALGGSKNGAEFEMYGPYDESKKSGGLLAMCLPTGAPADSVAAILVVYSCREVRAPTFLDYVLGGCAINVVLAIDFTASNGDPRKPGTLHYIADPSVQNEYEVAIRTIVGTLLQYVTDDNIPVYGFGARLPPDWETSHCFPLTGDPASPHVEGIDGIMAAYKSALKNVQLYGPTNFSEILRTGASFTSGVVTQKDQRYTIMVVLTDGVITDMEQTIGEIVNASDLPFSVVIVGIGAEDFSGMDILDADDKKLKYGDRVAKRDIVQFVPYRQFRNDPILLAREVLEEVPTQLIGYFKSRSIRPNPPIVDDGSSMSRLTIG